MATIRKRGELQWQAIVKRKGYPLQSKTWNTRKEAEAWARQIESEMDRGVFVSRAEVERTTLNDLIERYRVEVLPSKRGKHFGPALKVLDEHLGKYSLAALSPKLVAGFRDKRTKAGLSASTVKKEINLLSKIIDISGKEWGIALPANPCAMVSRPAEKNERDRRLEADEERYGQCERWSRSYRHPASVVATKQIPGRIHCTSTLARLPVWHDEPCFTRLASLIADSCGEGLEVNRCVLVVQRRIADEIFDAVPLK